MKGRADEPIVPESHAYVEPTGIETGGGVCVVDRDGGDAGQCCAGLVRNGWSGVEWGKGREWRDAADWS